MNIIKWLKNRWDYAKEQVYIANVLKLVDKMDDGTISGDMCDAYLDYYVLTGDYRALIDSLALRRPGRNRNPNDGASVYVNEAIFRMILVESFIKNREEASRILKPLYTLFEQCTIDLKKKKCQK